MTNFKTFKSKDNRAYRFKFSDDSITLKDSQINFVEKKIKEMNSTEIDKEGITLKNIDQKQATEIIKIIGEILGERSLQEILDDEIIADTNHSLERKSDTQVMIDRDWNQSAVTMEIAECIKRAFTVEKIRVKFDSKTRSNDHFRSFAYTIIGYKNGETKEQAKLVIGIEKDPEVEDSIIILITLLTPRKKRG